MQRVELLPQAYFEQRRQRRTTALVVTGGLVVLMLLAGYWLVLGAQITSAENELASTRASNERLQGEIDALQRFATMETELQAKQGALAQVMAGDVDWPRILTEVAMVIPGEVWLTGMTASAGQTEGVTPVGTESAPVRISPEQPFGRIQFTGSSLSMTGVSSWLERLTAVGEFSALWLNSATKSEVEGGAEVTTFDSTLELTDNAASRRFTEVAP
jgi:Tfp pilus assembly protein PilN